MAKSNKKNKPDSPRYKSNPLFHPTFFDNEIWRAGHKKILCDIILFDKQGKKLTFNDVALDKQQLNMPHGLKYLM